MTVIETVIEYQVNRIQKRKEHLIKIDAPQVIVDSCDTAIGCWQSDMVNRLQGKMKYKGWMNLPVLSQSSIIRKMHYFRATNMSEILVMETERGTMYYDTYGDKIAPNLDEL